MAEQIRVDSAGNPQVDFVWGPMAPQPNAEREVNLDPKLGDNPVYAKGHSGFPAFETEDVDHAPGVEDDEVEVVKPGDEKVTDPDVTVRIEGEGELKSAAEVKKAAKAKIEADKKSVAEQQVLDAAPLADVTAPDREKDAELVATEDPTPLDENKLTKDQQKALDAEKKAAESPVNKSVVMTPVEAIKAREADGRAPQAADLNEPIAPVTTQDATGQDKVKENHNPDSEPVERVVVDEAKAVVRAIRSRRRSSRPRLPRRSRSPLAARRRPPDLPSPT